MERRKETRYQARLTLQVYGPSVEMLLGTARMRDLSLSGLCFEDRSAIESGTTLIFRFQIPGKGSLSGVAEAKWTHPGALGRHLNGIEFKNFDWGYRKLLEEYLERSAADQERTFDRTNAA